MTAAAGWMKIFITSLKQMAPRDRWLHTAGEHTWEARCGEDAFLWFNDLQCYGVQRLPLPEGGHYRVEVIDVWNMTRETVCESASGETEIRLPGKEGLAVLAVRTKEES